MKCWNAKRCSSFLEGTKLEPNELGRELRRWRESGNFGPLKVACELFGVSHATLGAYEQGKGLPDVDFLAKFADVTGADFNELLRMRLASGKTDEARTLADRYTEVMENKGKYEESRAEAAQEDYIRGRFLGDEDADRRTAERLKNSGARLRAARAAVEHAEKEIDLAPTDYLHQALITLAFKYSIDQDDLVLLADAIKPHIEGH